MAIVDTLTEVGLPGSATTLSSPGKAVGASSINVGSTASWPANGKTVFFGIRTVNPSTISSGNPSGLVAGTYTVWKGIVATNSLTNLTLVFGSDQTYSAGTNTQVFIPVDALRHNALVTWGSQDHDLQGHHKTLTDVNGNSWISQSATASAVDGIQITNAATGGAPRVDAIGSDTTVPLYLGGKGGEPAHAENPEILSNFVASGGTVAISAGLVGTFSNIVYYIGGKRLKKASVPNKTYTASKDTYVDIDNTGAITYNEALNGAASPTLAANSIRIAKVVTSGSAITSITQNGTDSLNNVIYPISSIGFNGWKQFSGGISSSGGSIASGTCTGNYSQVGKTVSFRAVVTITNAGTGTGSVNFPLPVTSLVAAANTMVGYGREGALNGKMVAVYLSSATTASIFNYDNTTAIVTGATIYINGTYEAA